MPFRRLLLEQWSMLMLACGVGFVGPFGTYVRDRVADRIGTWWLLLMGAYLLVRPVIFLLRRLANATELSAGVVVFWGAALCSIPVAAVWRAVGRNAFRDMNGIAALLPFSALSALAVWAIAEWAEGADRRLRRQRQEPAPPKGVSDLVPDPVEPTRPTGAARASDAGSPSTPAGPVLCKRLPPSFAGPILALQSEDHYVRVHGGSDSALLLLRLRDAVAEMRGVEGEQVHRSWWIARSAISATERSGRSYTIHLTNGVVVPVARESVEHLRKSGFLPAELKNPRE